MILMATTPFIGREKSLVWTQSFESFLYLITHQDFVFSGIQVQTAECLVIGELTAQRMLVVLNKVDLLPIETREQTIHKLKKRLAKTFKLTKFWDCRMLPVAAKPGKHFWLGWQW